jgi:hypothetical protein
LQRQISSQYNALPAKSALLKPSDKTAIYYPLQQFRQFMLVLQRVSTEPQNQIKKYLTG